LHHTALRKFVRKVLREQGGPEASVELPAEKSLKAVEAQIANLTDELHKASSASGDQSNVNALKVQLANATAQRDALAPSD
jgi:hypothetical protein